MPAVVAAAACRLLLALEYVVRLKPWALPRLKEWLPTDAAVAEASAVSPTAALMGGMPAPAGHLDAAAAAGGRSPAVPIGNLHTPYTQLCRATDHDCGTNGNGVHSLSSSLTTRNAQDPLRHARNNSERNRSKTFTEG